ncbi:MAG: hypothetical protein K2Z81_24445 [Cyanobacteria bacterium]|nr:hypothetical protein [Cyanobacteriota bacterium]
MKLRQIVLLTSILFSTCCDNAEARFYRWWWNAPDTSEAGKQRRANLAERTHQMKELREHARLDDEKRQISARSTVKTYGKMKNSSRRIRSQNSALVHRQTNTQTSRSEF